MLHYEKTGEIRGPKTSRFAKCLMLDEDSVVIDVWMARAMGVPHDKVGAKYAYDACVNRVLKIADTYGEAPARIQAAIWSGVYRTFFKNPVVPNYEEALS
jgi:hypothetical protein